jgi:hypothetical protein
MYTSIKKIFVPINVHNCYVSIKIKVKQEIKKLYLSGVRRADSLAFQKGHLGRMRGKKEPSYTVGGDVD